jgi:uncharacterized protein DUF5615
MLWMDTEVSSAQNRPTPKEIEQVERYAARRVKPRFYADENFPDRAVALLRKLGGPVKTVREVGLRGHPDENQAAYAPPSIPATLPPTLRIK